jgi:chaperonin GroES
MAAVLPPNRERDRFIPGIPGVPEETEEVESPAQKMIENDDGSADFVLGEEASTAQTPGFDENLAETLDEVEMDGLASDLLRKIEIDKQARKKRDEQYEEGLKRTGLGKDAPGGAAFDGASRAVHPMLAEGCVDFAASAMRELFPVNGPAKIKIEGEITQAKITVAKRQERCLNWQMTDDIEEYPAELEQTLTQVPMGGSQYMKFWQDATLGRITCEFVPIDDVLIPYAASDFATAQRITHAQRITQSIFEERVESGFYRDVATNVPTTAPEETKARAASDKIEGKEAESENVDGERLVYEVNTYARLSVDDEENLPYLISIDEQAGKVVSIYRNWEEKDPSQTRLEWMVEYGFIAWRGAYKIGLPHLIGGLSAAATGALRALLDSAHFNNLPGFLRLKGARFGGQSKTIDPAQGVEIEASAAIDDIRKVIMPIPYGQPSPVLFQLLGWLTDAAKGVVTTAEEKIAEAKSQMPVGTTLALIEQGAKVFSTIHARLHRSQKRAFKIIARLNAKHLSTGRQMAKLGEVLATKEDFAKPLGISPVSDPNIFSESQRYAQMQMVLQMAEKLPQMHDLYKVLKRSYELAKIPSIDEFLIEPKKPKELNAAAENTALMLGAPIIAFPDQDHLAHIETHMRFAIDPFLGGAPFAAKVSLPSMMEHIKQHLGFLYAKTIFDIANQALGTDISEMMSAKKTDPNVDKVLAAASKGAHVALQQKLQPLGPVIQQMLQQIAAMQPPAPLDPSQTAMAVSKEQASVDKERNQIQAQKNQGDAALKAQDLQQKAEKDAATAAAKDRDSDIKETKVMVDATLGEKKLESQEQHQQLQLEEARNADRNDIPGV